MSASELDLEPLFAASRIRLAAIRERRRLAAEAAKPKLVVSTTPEVVEAVKANPTTLRVSAKAFIGAKAGGDDDVVVVDRPRRMEVIEVLEVVDAKPSRVRRLDCVTGEVSLEDWVGGYRQPAGAVSNYNPQDALRGSNDD